MYVLWSLLAFGEHLKSLVVAVVVVVVVVNG